MDLYLDQSMARVIMDDKINLIDKLKIYRGHFLHNPIASSVAMRSQDRELIQGICEEIALPLVEATRIGKKPFMVARGVFYSEAVDIPLVVSRVLFDKRDDAEAVRFIHGAMYAEVQHIMECFNTDDLYLFLAYPEGTFSMRVIARDDDYIRYLINREEAFFAIATKTMRYIH